MTHAYEVTDTRTGKVVARFKSTVAAYDYADRRDAAFGAVRFAVVRNHDVMTDEEFAAFMVRVVAERVAA